MLQSIKIKKKCNLTHPIIKHGRVPKTIHVCSDHFSKDLFKGALSGLRPFFATECPSKII